MKNQYSVIESKNIDHYRHNGTPHLNSVAQLSRGPFNAISEQLLQDDVSLIRLTTNQTLREMGHLPDQYCCLRLHKQEHSFYLRGRHYGRGGVSITQPGDEWESVLRKNHQHYLLIFSEDFLSKYLNDRKIGALNQFACRRGGVASAHRDYQMPILRVIDRAFEYLAKDIVTTGDNRFMSDVRDDLLFFVGNLVNVLQFETLRVNSNARLVDRALEIIGNSPLHDLKISEIAKQLHTHRRNLEIAFNHYLGLSPKEYIINLRLNRVRRDLLSTPAHKGNIASIAKSHGIVHLGNFSKAYCNLFAEKPSETRQSALKNLAAANDKIAAQQNTIAHQQFALARAN